MPLPPTYKFCSIPALIGLYTKFGSDPTVPGVFVTVGRPSWVPVNKIPRLFRKRDSLVDSLLAISETTLFLLFREKILTLTSHREGPFFTLNFRISQNNHISLYFTSYGLGFSPICPRRPGEGWEPSGGGFAPLHRPFGRPAFFMAGPRVTEVSLSGSTRRLNYSVFKVLR